MVIPLSIVMALNEVYIVKCAKSWREERRISNRKTSNPSSLGSIYLLFMVIKRKCSSYFNLYLPEGCCIYVGELQTHIL